MDDGRFAVKRIVGEAIEVSADILRDGHDVLAAAVLWSRDGEAWKCEPMRHVDNDRWAGAFTPTDIGRYRYAIAAWTDTFATWRHGFELKRDAGQDVDIEAQEGRALLTEAKSGSPAVRRIVRDAAAAFDEGGGHAVLTSDQLAAAMSDAEPRPDRVRSRVFPLTVERERARAGAWYEIFPRSAASERGRHGTFRDVMAIVPSIAAHGYDVLYFTPIHPIGEKNRKGRNNSLTAAPDDPGSPYAIGGAAGGHDAI
ncbi:MAG: DUF3416 domain-containing protein, partial [Rhizobiales bacterium]|nr:DUF3416 domain-containing protein [Hyphomicrobiales bacterium]